MSHCVTCVTRIYACGTLARTHWLVYVHFRVPRLPKPLVYMWIRRPYETTGEVLCRIWTDFTRELCLLISVPGIFRTLLLRCQFIILDSLRWETHVGPLKSAWFLVIRSKTTNFLNFVLTRAFWLFCYRVTLVERGSPHSLCLLESGKVRAVFSCQLRNRKRFPCFHRVKENKTSGSLGEREMLDRRVFPQLVRVFPYFHGF